jgi:hypothetical protein
MSNTITVDATAAPPRRLFSKLQLQFALVAVTLVAVGYWLNRDTTIRISTETRRDGLATIVWVMYDDVPKFVYIYGAPREFDKVLRGVESNSAGEFRALHGTVNGEAVRIASDAGSGLITIGDHKYDLSRGRTFTIALQNDGAVTQYDVDVPLPTEPASAERPYRFDIPNAEVVQFIRSAQAGM